MILKQYLTAYEASEALGVTKATLYSYVSRGLIRSEGGEIGKREKRYSTEDVEKLKYRSKNLQKGDLDKNINHKNDYFMGDSEITLINDGFYFYRGINVLKLATNQSFERVSSLIWTGKTNFRFSIPQDNYWGEHKNWSYLKTLRVIERFRVLLTLAESEDLSAYTLHRDGVAATGMRIIWLLTRAATGGEPLGGVANVFSMESKKEREGSAKLINAFLVLLADTEMDAATLAVRCAASAGASPYGSVSAGLSVFSGYKFSSNNERVEAFFKEAEASRNLEEMIIGRIRRGEIIPGFGQNQDQEIDTRAVFLLKMIEKTFPESNTLKLAWQIIEVTQKLMLIQYNIDFVLVVLLRILDMPKEVGLTLLTLARTAGWIGHSIEQYDKNSLIQPKVNYVGTFPSS
tara:strand:- start:8726 stop:9934 length:1209 start_codon:yes stop_codon:yes gene_type:complete